MIQQMARMFRMRFARRSYGSPGGSIKPSIDARFQLSANQLQQNAGGNGGSHWMKRRACVQSCLLAQAIDSVVPRRLHVQRVS